MTRIYFDCYDLNWPLATRAENWRPFLRFNPAVGLALRWFHANHHLVAIGYKFQVADFTA
ncbi:hypothetical protein [Gaoshiqia sediminis]|uniref:Uncharacterized protein n=1 Tax=Gaoshiqia sediminis TaxID=2986998 RepID=A0AA42C7H7_9BACT|nr:hypothetical protein [Gaoshiqia sediminis]MCW0484998.1 hypothetical protein [Gaoshiqia sediminis]